jgi:hypothetical protein
MGSMTLTIAGKLPQHLQLQSQQAGVNKQA